MSARTYKKYMKKNAPKEYSLLKLFILSFFGMLLIFTFLIKSFTPTVDVSIGEYKQEPEVDNSVEMKKIVDGRLAMIQEEDQGKDFTRLIEQATDEKKESEPLKELTKIKTDSVTSKTDELDKIVNADSVYKVFIGSYTTAEQAKVAKDIIVESGVNLNPIVKCIGSNNYTLQVGIFKNKTSADALLYTIQQNHLPGRIVQDY